MKDKWYADNNDLVKWSVLLQIACGHGVEKIVQVPYYRRETSGMVIEIDGREHQMPEAVVRHFRDVMDITRLNGRQSIKVEVLELPFTDRNTYLDAILAKVPAAKSVGPTCIVFLDPDTGLEPSKPNWEHVLKSELGRIWGAMRSGDVLVFYQQRDRAGRGPLWFEPRRAAFRDALKIPDTAVKIAQGGTRKKKFPVVLFFAQKVSPLEPASVQSPPALQSTVTQRTQKIGNVCPECGHQFKGNGFDGIDAHWRARHDALMSYKEAWPLIKSGNYRRKAFPNSTT